MPEKYRGRKSITFEVLKNILRISENDNIEIIDVIRTEEDRTRDTFSVLLTSNGETEYTKRVREGCRFPEV